MSDDDIHPWEQEYREDRARNDELSKLRAKIVDLKREAKIMRSDHDKDSEDDGVRLAWYLWDGAIANYDEVLVIIDEQVNELLDY